MAWPPQGTGSTDGRRTVAAGLVGVVALSAVLTGVYGGASAPELAAVAAGGAVAGTALAVVIGLWP